MNQTDGYTRLCGLMGNPVEHTISPVLHNYLAEATGENLVYVPFHVPQEKVKEAIEGAYALNLLGLNVTVPYKSRVIPFLKDIDPLAEKIGAVNTLVRCAGGYKGYNTDMPGLYRAMCSDGTVIEGEEVILLGAGGVAKAVALLLAVAKATKIYILNRSIEKAETIADSVNRHTGTETARAMALQEWEALEKGKRYLAVQATNVGMFPHVEEAVIENPAFYEKIHTGYDLIFNPDETRFMRLVKEQGGRAYNGSKMLLYQGIIAYELWTGREISDLTAGEAYARMREAMT